MTNPEIECPDCGGEGFSLFPTILCCTACEGTGYRPMTDDERDDRAEREDMERNAG